MHRKRPTSDHLSGTITRQPRRLEHELVLRAGYPRGRHINGVALRGFGHLRAVVIHDGDARRASLVSKCARDLFTFGMRSYMPDAVISSMKQTLLMLPAVLY